MKGKACFQGETKSLGIGELGLWGPGWALSPEPRGHSPHGVAGRAGRQERPRRAPSPRVSLTVEGGGPVSRWEGLLTSRAVSAVAASTGSPCRTDTRLTHMGPWRGPQGPQRKAREGCLMRRHAVSTHPRDGCSPSRGPGGGDAEVDAFVTTWPPAWAAARTPAVS